MCVRFFLFFSFLLSSHLRHESLAQDGAVAAQDCDARVVAG
jgi:hypothetical protein